MSQLSYSTQIGKAVAGLLAALNPARTTTFNNTVDKMFHGQFAVRVTGDDNGCKRPASSGDVFIGAVLRDLTEIAPESGNDGIVAKGAVPVLHDGECWMRCEEAVAVGDTPYAVYAGKKQVQTITLSTDLISGNVITTVVNGTSVSSTYASSHAATIAAHAALIAAISGVSAASASGDVITVTSDNDTTLTITSSVASGASQPTVTIAETVAMLPTTNTGMLRNDDDSSRAVSVANNVTILGYDSGTQLARVRVDFRV